MQRHGTVLRRRKGKHWGKANRMERPNVGLGIITDMGDAVVELCLSIHIGEMLQPFPPLTAPRDSQAR